MLPSVHLACYPLASPDLTISNRKKVDLQKLFKNSDTFGESNILSCILTFLGQGHSSKLINLVNVLCLEILSKVRGRWLPHGCLALPLIEGMLVHGNGISNCRLSTKKKRRALPGGEQLEGPFSVEFSKMAGASSQRVGGVNVSIAEGGRKALTSV